MTDSSSTLVLASGSKWRAAMLRDAGIAIETDPADIDERAIEKPLLEADLPPADIASVLAETKASVVSERHPGRLVLGADQVLELEGKIFSKPSDQEEARRNLLALRGRTHYLHSAIALARDGETIWRHVAPAEMTMRDFSPEFLGHYMAAVGDAVLGSVGCYQIEGPGVQLFERIDGDTFTVVGLPLMPLLAYLRDIGALET